LPLQKILWTSAKLLIPLGHDPKNQQIWEFGVELGGPRAEPQAR